MRRYLFFLLLCLSMIQPGDSMGGQSSDSSNERGTDEGIVSGIVRVTRGQVDLTVPKSTPPGQEWRYGLGVVFQVSPTLAGILCNIRIEGTPYGDFEVGTDLILFDRHQALDEIEPIPISRSTEEPDPETADPSIMAKFPVIGGFVPKGAKLPGGRAHPHEGSGFGLCTVEPYPKDFNQPLRRNLPSFLEIHQFSYDGRSFRSSAPRRHSKLILPGGWEVLAHGLSTAIADGEDLLFTLVCSRGNTDRRAGVGRFRCEGGQWRPISFVPVSPSGSSWTEPSLIRDLDSTLLFTARGGRQGPRGDLPLWRSSDGGQHWEQLFYLQGQTAGGPLALNQAADGTPYIATNQPPLDRRVLLIWPVNQDRTGLGPSILARDSDADFGKPPHSDAWKVDHPIGTNVRLRDGEWHSLLVYRVLDQGENVGAPPTVHTGFFVEEVFSKGKPRPPWAF